MNRFDNSGFKKAFEAYSESKNTIEGIEAAILAYIGQNNPVAWLIRHRDDGLTYPWGFTMDVEDTMGVDIESQPLYPLPPDAVPRSEMLDALANQRRRMGDEYDALYAELRRARLAANQEIIQLRKMIDEARALSEQAARQVLDIQSAIPPRDTREQGLR